MKHNGPHIKGQNAHSLLGSLWFRDGSSSSRLLNPLNISPPEEGQSGPSNPVERSKLGKTEIESTEAVTMPARDDEDTGEATAGSKVVEEVEETQL